MSLTVFLLGGGEDFVGRTAPEHQPGLQCFFLLSVFCKFSVCLSECACVGNMVNTDLLAYWLK